MRTFVTEFRCDAPGCENGLDVELLDAERICPEAESNGWEVSARGDFCPEHSVTEGAA